jgi:hypothetical protein
MQENHSEFNFVSILIGYFVVLDGVMVIVLAIGPKVRGFRPGRERLMSEGDETSQYGFLRRESKAVGPM